MTEKDELVQALREPMLTQEQIDAMPEADRPMWQRALDSLARKDDVIREAMEEGDYDRVLVMHGSEQRALPLIACCADVCDGEARRLVEKWWSVTEAWSGDPVLRAGMHDLIKRVAYVETLDEDHPRPLPSGMVTIFRGNNGETPDEGVGSWTLDYDQAVFFASATKSLRGMFLGLYDEDGVPSIWRAYVPAGKVLGYFDDRAEQEVVVDAADLIDITLVAEAQ